MRERECEQDNGVVMESVSSIMEADGQSTVLAERGTDINQAKDDWVTPSFMEYWFTSEAVF